MIYLDYSATTPVNKEVLDTFNKASIEFVGNANSSNRLGVKCNTLIEEATEQIKEILKLNNSEVIYTSGSSEANNLAIKGIALKYQNRGKHIITTNFEHSSVYGPIAYLKSLGFEISYVNSNENGVVDIEHLKSLIREDTILVSVNAVNSEIGILEPIDEIGEILKQYKKCFYHVDLTQAIGKIKANFENIDLASISAHKIYGLKGIGCLVKKNNIELEPLIHGGKSTSIYRSGTPVHPLIASFSKAIRLSSYDIEKKYEYVKELNLYLQNELSKYDNVYVNSNEQCIPHILNISVLGIKAETFMRYLSDRDIIISTKSACHDEDSKSLSVYNLTNSEDLAKSSIRISISYLTSKEDIAEFLKVFAKAYEELRK